MQYIRLGNTGLKVSKLCLGMMTYGSSKWRPWVLDEEQSRPFIRKALEQGITFYDTADIYSNGASEEVLGRAIKEFARRDAVVIATKVFFKMGEGPNDGGLSRKHVLAAIDDSLRRLQTDYVDLYQIHRWDYETPIEETLGALNDVVRAGKARYIGASSMFAWQFATALHLSERHGWARFAAMQNHYNLVYREEEREMIPLCRAAGVGLIPWSPLARGFLAGNRSRGKADEKSGATIRAKTDDYAKEYYFQPEDFTVAERAAQIAKKLGKTAAQVALAWVASRPGITAPIIGASKPGQIEAAIDALSIDLSDEDVRLLEEPYRPHAVLGHE